MKKVLSVQDISCVGKCSMTVALPVLSAMGVSCSVLPTAILSTHTGFPQPHVRSLTEDIVPICRHWQENGVSFDAVQVGYLSDPEQVSAVETVLDAFHGLKVIDPVLGDHGKLYSRMTADHVEAMKRLCRKGNILLPNVTEAARLTGTAYRENGDRAYYRDLLEKLMGFGPDVAAITGVSLEPGKTGFMGMNEKLGTFSFQSAQIKKESHGTGDMFTAAFTGAYLHLQNAYEAGFIAAEFVSRVLSQKEEPSAFGLEFEKQLPWLWEQI